MGHLRRAACVFGFGLFALGVAACGGGGGGTITVAGILTCEGAALAADPQLPAGFPRPSGVTYVESKKQGPTTLVSGYYEGSLEDAYDAYKDGFDRAGYGILFDEKEQRDAEVSYEDATRATNGQVALRSQCENGNVSVRITNRPA